MEIGAFVRRERKRLKLTQNELAERAGVGLNFVYQLEKNKKTVQMDTTNQVLMALGYAVGVVRHFEPWVSQSGLDEVPSDGSRQSRRVGATSKAKAKVIKVTNERVAEEF